MSIKVAQQMWPVRRGCLLLHGTWSYLRIGRGSVLPCTWFCICFLDYDYVWYIVNLTTIWKSESHAAGHREPGPNVKTFEYIQENSQLKYPSPRMGEQRIFYVCTYLCLRMLSRSRIFPTLPFSDLDIWVENFLENTQKFYDSGARS
jgi:hypothetical protein